MQLCTFLVANVGTDMPSGLSYIAAALISSYGGYMVVDPCADPLESAQGSPIKIPILASISSRLRSKCVPNMRRSPEKIVDTRVNGLMILGWISLTRAHSAYPQFSQFIPATLNPNWAEQVFQTPPPKKP